MRRGGGWNRTLWGMRFNGHLDKSGFLIATTWDSEGRMFHPGEPSRALLFKTRTAARMWCKWKNDIWRSRSDLMNKWRVRAVRVRETVREL